MSTPPDPAAPGEWAGAVDAVLLDVDDTLVDTRGAFTASVDAVRRAFLPDVGPERLDAMVALWRADPHGRYRAYTRGEVTFDEQRRRRADELHRAFGGPPVDEASYPAWLEVFWGAFEAAWRPFADARTTVDALTRAGLLVGAVTNAGADLQRRKLAACGLADVPVLVTVETFGVGKPDPRVFREGAHLLGADPGRTVYVGDELDVDALGAVRAGLRGVWLDRPGTRRGGPHAEDPATAVAAGAVVVPALTGLVGLLV
ncbi:HAD family hydrolase [Luteimicrobium subarcticum]|uniref:Putative hydrolase of the HAD superfamily n=1 Tax=Luteimicrobium subarcticum TaxID=620910 RepID=A0A2M8WQS8_9MICO|nr:HAD family hydrolase [Luteimicrobium subarcticum]PJI93244.1 putative hydrolase of the HAD superfamily [Luteimicrobium subarcticum]